MFYSVVPSIFPQTSIRLPFGIGGFEPYFLRANVQTAKANRYHGSRDSFQEDSQISIKTIGVLLNVL